MEIYKYMAVFGLGILEIWGAVPLGLAMAVNVWVTGLLAALGGVFGVVVVLAVGAPLRERLLRLRKGGKAQPSSRVSRIFDRWGLIGLALLAPAVVGGPIGAAFAVAAGAPRGRTLLWFSIGVLLWTAIATACFAGGLLAYQKAGGA